MPDICPSCGHCPTCGHPHPDHRPGWPFPYHGPYPWWSISMETGTTPDMGDADKVNYNITLKES